MQRWIPILSAMMLGAASIAMADTVTVNMERLNTDGSKTPIGHIQFTDTQYGLMVMPTLSDLSPGVHGFHVHQQPSCDNYGMAAGDHLDPAHTGKHLGPYTAAGHQGDLPILVVDAQGKANLPALAPRLAVSDLVGHAVIIHAGGDNYADEPQRLGGGGARIACGVVASATHSPSKN